MFKRLLFAASLILLVSGTIACGSTTTTPSTDVSRTAIFASRLQEKGSAWRTFQVVTAGQVTLQLTSLTQTDAVMRLGLGTVSGTNCAVNQSVDTAASSTTNAPQITATLAVGTYCVRVADIGNLTTIYDFSVLITSPF